MGVIVSIGGGSIRELETLVIDEYIVSLTKKECPRALFIPTASGDAQTYIDVFNNVYREKLRCITDTLLLTNSSLSEEEIKNKILSSDIIYVGGGDTSKMLEIWRKYKVDKYLKMAHEKGIILAGLSAGSICWFKYGYSKNDSDYICLEALGFIDAIHCPHYDEEDRKGFDLIIDKFNKIGIALENNCSIVFKDDSFRVIKGNENASAYKLFNEIGKIQKYKLINEDYKSINELYDYK
ncbi:peptidase E [Clostridium sp.]|uniref:Type 1 glutamine amidotransferase-like domain-containing protein n=1 Tax=Clostridium sp. TaxID=1506 RepID=UPI0032179B9D